MNRIILIISFFLINTALLAQRGHTILGSVKDSLTNNRIPNVNITVVETGKGGSSNYSGDFKISIKKSGNYTLRFDCVGYGSKEVKYNLDEYEFTSTQVLLNKNTVQMESVNVIKTINHQINHQLPVKPLAVEHSTTLVSSDDIKKTGAVNVIQALNYIPGGLVESRGRKVKHFFSMRGQAYPYPDYAINGIWQKEFHETPSFFSANDIEEIEIIRSSAAILTGLNGLTGIVNIKTKSPIKPYTRVETKYGTYNTVNASLSHGQAFDNFKYSLGANHNQTNGPDNRNGAENLQNYYLSAEYKITPQLTANTMLFHIQGERELLNAVAPAGKKYIENNQKFDPISSTFWNTKFKYNPNKYYSGELQISYAFRDTKFKYTSGGEAKNVSEEETEYGFNFINHLSLIKNNTFSFGTLYNRWKAPNGKRYYTGNECDLETYSAVIADEHKLGKLTLDAGVRVTKIKQNKFGTFIMGVKGKVYKKNLTKIEDEWTPATIQSTFGAHYRINNTTSASFNMAYGNIEPQKGAVTKVGENIYDDTKNERRSSFDLGIQTQILKSSLNINLFSIIRDEAIQYSPEIFTADNGDLLPLFINQDYRNFGIEIDFKSAQIAKMVSFFTNLTTMKIESKIDGSYKKNSLYPETIVNSGVNFNLKGFDLNLFGKYVSEFENSRFAGDKKMHKLGDFTNLNLVSSYEFKKPNITVSFEINNITDKEFSTVVGYPDLGRRFTVGVSYKL